MKVGVRVLWHVIVEDNVDPLNVNPPAEEVSRAQDAFAEGLEGLVFGQPAQRCTERFDGALVISYSVCNGNSTEGRTFARHVLTPKCVTCVTHTPSRGTIINNVDKL